MKAIVLKITFILLPLVVWICVFMWYRAPITIFSEMTVCTIDGKTAEATINIAFHRYFLQPTRISGSIYLNGNSYTVWNISNQSRPSRRQLFTQMREQSGRPYRQVFYDFDNMLVGSISMFPRVALFFETMDRDLNFISISYIPYGHRTGFTLFGPAATPEEALSIAKLFTEHWAGN